MLSHCEGCSLDPEKILLSHEQDGARLRQFAVLSLPNTRALLQRTADVRLPLDMPTEQLSVLATVIVETLQ